MSYFEGYYIKCAGKQDTLSVILGRAINREKTSFVQIITQDNSYYEEFSYKGFFTDKRKFEMRIGSNSITEKGLSLNINTKGLVVTGEVKFGVFDKIKSDAMGPLRFLPFLECRHTIISMRHDLKGQVTVNGKIYEFDAGCCYIEGDRGRSFPRKYFWTQANFSDDEQTSVFASCAVIPYLGFKFNGTICIIHMGRKEFRFATYLGARIKQFDSSKLVIHQGKQKHKMYLEIEVLDSRNARPLLAPTNGKMNRTVQESVERTVRYKFVKGAQTVFDLTSNRAAYEYSDTNI